ncbi:MAG: ABC transporter permease, partial [bacterium]
MAVLAERAPARAEVAGQGYWQIAWGRFKKHRTAMFGGLIILLFITTAVFASVLTPFTFDQIDLYKRKAAPSWLHPMGTDELGHDVLTRLLYAGRISLAVGFIAAFTAAV